MKDPVARRLASIAVAIALVALVLAGWSAYRSESELREVGRAVQRAVELQRPTSLGPPPTFDTED